MSEPGHTNGYLEYNEYLMPGRLQYPVALNTQTFNAYMEDDDFMMSSYLPVVNTITYLRSPSPYGIISYFNELPCPQRAVYVVQEEDVHLREEAIGLHLQYNQIVQATAQRLNLTVDDEDNQVEDDDMDNYQEQQSFHPNLIHRISPEITTETLDKNQSKPKTQGKRKRIYQAEQGYLVEEPSSEPSDEVLD